MSPKRCYNDACQNKNGEVRLILIETDGNVVKDNYPLRFWLCPPCAESILLMTTFEGTWPDGDAESR